jgi:ABC-2 type transport system ATP-binding protein
VTSSPGAVPAVHLAAVRKKFDQTVALDDLTFDVAPGEMFGVIGPDGAGKTTALRLICGLMKPDAGTVQLFGQDPFRAHRAATAALGYVSQRFSLYGDLSIDENIEFFSRLHGVNDFSARRARLLDLTGLAPFHDRLADRLSGGMKQKLALACTLVHEPTMLVLDEPTTGVDPVSRREFWKLLAEFLSQGLTIVLATPYLDEAERCHRVVLMHEGRALALDTPANLQASLAGTDIEIVVSPVRKALDVVRSVAGADRAQLFGDRLHVRVDRPEAVTPIVAQLHAAGLEPTHVRPIVPALEDVFIERVQRS